MMMTMMTWCSKLVALPTLYSAMMIIIGATTEHCLTATTSLLLMLVLSDHTDRSPTSKFANSLHHRPAGFKLEDFLCSELTGCLLNTLNYCTCVK